jgi:hypothetical protein
MRSRERTGAGACWDIGMWFHHILAMLSIFGIAVATAIAAPASAAEQRCDRHAALNQIPGRFEEIARGDLSGTTMELVVLTDGTCTCDNLPAVMRELGKPAPANVNWYCRDAMPNERRSD